MKKTSKKGAGFTLIELLVVIAIIGLLATIAVIALNQARSNSRDSKRIGDLKQINTALQLYYSRSQDFEYPASEDQEFRPLVGYNYDSSCRFSTHSDPFIPGLDDLDPEIMPIRPDEPLDSRLTDNGTNCYIYITTDDTKGEFEHYYLMALLENKESTQKCTFDSTHVDIQALNNRAGTYCFQSDKFE